MTKREHPLSWNAIIRVIIAAAIVYLLWHSIGTIVLVIISMMLASALYPIALKLSKYMPLSLASMLVVLTLLAPIILIGATVIPNLIKEFPQIQEAITKSIQSSGILPESVKSLDFSKYFNTSADYLVQSTGRITNVLTTFLTVLFLTFYLMSDYKRLKELVILITPDEREGELEKLAQRLAKINGQYIRGNLIISLVCGIVTFIGLSILKVPYTGALALFAGILDLLPLIGAFIGAIPAVIIGFSISPTVGFLVIGLFIVYQQFENLILAPNVYNKALDLSPALAFLAVILGSSLFGIVGAFLALPIAASIPTLIKYMRKWELNKSEYEIEAEMTVKPSKFRLLKKKL